MGRTYFTVKGNILSLDYATIFVKQNKKFAYVGVVGEKGVTNLV